MQTIVTIRWSLYFIRLRSYGSKYFLVPYYTDYKTTDRKYPLEEIAEAYRYVAKGQKTGNVVITVAHNNKA